MSTGFQTGWVGSQKLPRHLKQHVLHWSHGCQQNCGMRWIIWWLDLASSYANLWVLSAWPAWTELSVRLVVHTAEARNNSPRLLIWNPPFYWAIKKLQHPTQNQSDVSLPFFLSLFPTLLGLGLRFYPFLLLFKWFLLAFLPFQLVLQFECLTMLHLFSGLPLYYLLDILYCF